MPDAKITALTAISTVDPAADVLPIVDVSDTSMAASGTTKKITSNQILGAGGTATLASATITGDLTVKTNVLKVDSTNNRVGIGTASPTDLLHLRGTGTQNLKIQTATSGDPTLVLEAAGADGASIAFDRTNNYLRFDCSSSTGAMCLSTTGNLGLGVTPSAGGGVLQLKSGITFPATQVASSDANTLDDYEEGTWTGTLKGSVSDPTTPVTATGRYTKIGRQVSVIIDFGAFNSTGASGNATIIGLPFANGLLSCGTAESGSALTFSGTLTADVSTGGTTIQFQSITSNAYANFATHNAGNPRYLTVALTYTV